MNDLFSSENKATVAARSIPNLEEQIRQVYLEDKRPWVIGYSGGKDSTCALQLIWKAIESLPEEKRQKSIYVLSSDTLVETPIIINYIDGALAAINSAAREQGMPITARKVVPIVKDSFWVNLIGKGYPAPSKRFRWCTERLKIDPANAFIKKHGGKVRRSYHGAGSTKGGEYDARSGYGVAPNIWITIIASFNAS